ncbi:MAG: hypothetical protein ACREVX_04675 [Clostridium sp.]|uniref:hypothetical protein n=1 Tax=Clostridium sp. TaxID=1506 RepID=UPI003D6D0174
MKKIEDYSPYELTSLAAIIGAAIAAKLNVNQQNSVGNFIVDIGASISTIAAQSSFLETQDENIVDNKST